MKHLAFSLAAAAVAGMTAVPAGAQTKIQAEVLDLPTSIPIAVADRLPPENTETVIIETTGPMRLAQDRYYDADRRTYALFDPGASVWRIHDAETDAVIDTVAVGRDVPAQVGMGTVEIQPDLATREPAPAVAPEPTRRAGMAEERYYDPERRTYAVHLPVKSVWQIFDAETGRPMEVVTDGEFDPYEPGYTVVMPREAQAGMGTTGGPLLDRDVIEVIEAD